jgi:DNA-binding response OmpR family regulator
MTSTLATRVRDIFQPRAGHLLIVEDEPELRDLFADFFGARGYKVSVAGTLEQSEACLKSEQFDAVLHDIILPDGNGIDAIPHIKLNYPNLPVIILTALGYEEDSLRAAMQNGAAAYISKLMPLDQVLMEIHRVLRFSRWQPE